ncbi:MAG: GntR family transcriptional regulator [Armatimonadota bacterium]
MGMIRRRDAGKQTMLLAELRDRIVRGELTPGQSLTARQLQQEYQVGASVVQSAVHALVADGFLVTEDRSGTFVSLTPPHLNTYGVVYRTPSPLTGPPDGRYYSMLAYECLARQQTGDLRLNLYFNVSGHQDEPDYQRLVDDIEARRLTGLIFFELYGGLFENPILMDARLPKALAYQQLVDYQIPYCALDLPMFLDKGMAYLASRGRTRMAVIKALDSGPYQDLLHECSARHGITIKPHWIFEGTPNPTPLLTAATYLLLDHPRERPDALFIWDDILVEPVVKGALAAGIHIGRDLDIVAHCNYPLTKPDQLPIKRLGFSMRMVLQEAIRLINLQRDGQPVPEKVDIPALFDDDPYL